MLELGEQCLELLVVDLGHDAGADQFVGRIEQLTAHRVETVPLQEASRVALARSLGLSVGSL